MSNHNTELAKDVKLGMVSYNNEVIKYNDLYSELLGKFISNQVLAEQILESLPTFSESFEVEKAAIFFQSDQDKLLSAIKNAKLQVMTQSSKSAN